MQLTFRSQPYPQGSRAYEPLAADAGNMVTMRGTENRDVYECVAFAAQPTRSVDAVAYSPAVTETITDAFLPEHLGMRLGVLEANQPLVLRSPEARFPGYFQAPLVACANGSMAAVLYAHEFPSAFSVRPRADGRKISLEFVRNDNQPIAPSSVLHFVVWFKIDTSPGTTRQRIGRLMRELYDWRERSAPSPDANSHAILPCDMFGMQTQDTSDPTQAMLEHLAMFRKSIPRTVGWGMMSDLRGSCCREGITEIHARNLEMMSIASAANHPIYHYRNPNRNGVFDPAALDCPDGVYQYLDTVGFRDTRGCSIGARHIIEGASTLHRRNPALAANAIAGGGFAVPGGGLPRTLPDLTPEPRNPNPCYTAAPWFLTPLHHSRVILNGDHNYDGYFGGQYRAPDGRIFEDGLWAWCHLLGHRLLPRTPQYAGVQQLLSLRNGTNWAYGARFLDQEGIESITRGWMATRFQRADGVHELRAWRFDPSVKIAKVVVDGREESIIDVDLATLVLKS